MPFCLLSIMVKNSQLDASSVIIFYSFSNKCFNPGCFLSSRIKALILEHKGSLVLELQQRAIEFGSILTKHNDIKFVLLLPYI